MPESPWLQIAGIVFAVVVVLPLFWCFVVWLLSSLSGWGRLVRPYESNRRFEGDIRRWQSARIGWINYNNVLTIVLMDEGVGIAPFPLFSMGHPPLLIPWGDINYEGPKRGLFGAYEIFHFGRTDPVRVMLAPNVIDPARFSVRAEEGQELSR